MSNNKSLEKAFAYPVLGRSNDYLDAEFQVAIEIKEQEVISEEIILDYAFSLSDEAILEKIESGHAAYGLDVSCSATMTAQAFHSKSDTGQFKLTANKYFSKVDIKPVIFVKKPITEFSSVNFNPEYEGMSFNLILGDVLAITDTEFIYVQPKFVKFESMLEFKSSPKMDPWLYEINTEGEHLVVHTGLELQKAYVNLRSKDQTRPHLMMSIYKDVIMFCLNHLKDIPDTDTRWAQSFYKMLDNKGYKNRIDENTPLSEINRIAQEVVGTRGVKAINSQS